MKVKLLAFAQARLELGWSEQVVECEAADTPASIVSRLSCKVPLQAWRVAVDGEYCSWNQPIGAAAEIAIIPPVSGG